MYASSGLSAMVSWDCFGPFQNQQSSAHLIPHVSVEQSTIDTMTATFSVCYRHHKDELQMTACLPYFCHCHSKLHHRWFKLPFLSCTVREQLSVSFQGYGISNRGRNRKGSQEVDTLEYIRMDGQKMKTDTRKFICHCH